jgi:hypothetical protein
MREITSRSHYVEHRREAAWIQVWRLPRHDVLSVVTVGARMREERAAAAAKSGYVLALASGVLLRTEVV